MTSPIVFFDIAGPDDGQLRAFYAGVFGWEFSARSKTAVQVATPLEGAIRKDPPEHRLYLGVPEVGEALRRVEASGGTIEAPRFEVPGVAILGLFRDPAGNAMGLVELEGDRPRIP